MLLRSCALAAIASSILSLGCGGTDGGDGDASGPGHEQPSSGAGASGSGGNLGISSGSGGGGNAPVGEALIFAHTDTTLYTLDPHSSDLELTEIGAFDCIGTDAGKDSAMTDFGVNADLDLWGISGHDVHPLVESGAAVHCNPQIKLDDPDVRFYALTFAPAGVIDPAKEVLVAGNTAGELWSIDEVGAVTQRGVFGTVPADDGNGHSYDNVGKTWELSGDLVFLANGGSPVGFATVRDCPAPPATSGCNFVNTLIEIDVPLLGTAKTEPVIKSVRGQIVKAADCDDGTDGNYGNMYGIAVWDDKMFGFSRTGNLVQISMEDGSACLVRHYADDAFAGAGVTTMAPVVVPAPK